MLAVGTVQVPVSVPTYKLPKQPSSQQILKFIINISDYWGCSAGWPVAGWLGSPLTNNCLREQ